MKLAVLAIGLAMGASACRPRASAPSSEPRPPASLSVDAVPRFFPSYVKPCASTEFRAVMSEQFNAALSSASQALFHDADEGRLDRVADAAAVILGCAKQLDNHRPAKVAEGEWMTFDHMMIQLVMNTHALQSAALEDDEEVVVHWFHHVKQTCAGCHARFNEE